MAVPNTCRKERKLETRYLPDTGFLAPQLLKTIAVL
jgi:hypothetical protein